jgi:hypothetical protein
VVGRSGDGIQIGARFSAPVQTGPEAPPASYRMGTVSFPWVKQPERGVDHPPASSAEVKERVEVNLYSPSELRGLLQGELYRQGDCLSPSAGTVRSFTWRHSRKPLKTSFSLTGISSAL